jgi:hypothetical protein
MNNKELPPPAPITPEEWDMPVTFGKDQPILVSLRQSVEHQFDTIPVSFLTDDQWFALTAERIKRTPSFGVCMFGFGVLNQERAVAELEARSDAGKLLKEIEERLVKNLYARALDEQEKSARP